MSGRQVLGVAVVLGLIGSAWVSAVAGDASMAATARPNVLFIAVDDLNHWVGYTGRNPQVKTPNIDRLSKMGVSFTHAYCAAPLCNPSRAALMSGMRPGTTACYVNADNWKEYIPEGKGLTAAFKRAGYYVAGAGKIYHNSTYYPSEWDDYGDEWGGFGSEEDRDAVRSRTRDIDKYEAYFTPLKHDIQDSDLSDWHIVDYCIAQLKRKHDKPFFLACGVHKPHLPWVVPKSYYDMFPLESIELPPYRDDDLEDIPPEGVRMAKPEADHARMLKTGRWKAAVQSYLATIAYTDKNIGRLLDAFEQSEYATNTIICFWGDHGWHLGEKHHWRKFTLWEEAARAPFIWVVPGLTPPGTICERTVDFMSMYPTLCELAGITKPPHVEGVSIRTLLADPKASWDIPAVTTFGYKNHAVRTEGWRYISYEGGGEELYDERADPYEWTNLADQAGQDERKQALRAGLPSKNTPPRVKERPQGKTRERGNRKNGEE